MDGSNELWRDNQSAKKGQIIRDGVHCRAGLQEACLVRGQN